MNRIKWQYKLFFLSVLIAVIPALIISINMISITETQLTSNVNDELINASRLLTYEIDLFFEEFADKQEILRSSVENDELGANEKVSILVSAVEDIAELVSIKLLFQNSFGSFDEAVTVIKESYESQDSTINYIESLFSQSYEQMTKEVLGSNRMQVGNAQYIGSIRKWIVPIISSVQISNAPNAFLFSIVDISEIENRLNENSLLGVGNVYIVNSNREFIFNNPFLTNKINIVLDDAVEMLNNIARMQAVNNYKRDGKDIVTSIAFPKSLNWAVVSEMDSDVAYAAVAQMNKVFLIWILFGIGIAFVAVLLFTQTVSKPINYLAEKAKIISSGNFDISTNYKANDSIGLLGNTLVSMSKSLKQSFQKIEAQNRELEEYNRTLEEKVKERTLELKSTNDQLQEAYMKVLELNRDKNEFLGIAAHDLKNPLIAIKGFGHMIIDDEEMKRSFVEDFARSIIDSSERMFSIITNLLDVNKIEEGKIDVKYDDVNLTKVVKDLLVPNNENAKKKNIELVFNSEINDELFKTDKNLIAQILDNLISNAIKFSPTDKSVFVDIYNNPKEIKIAIKDQGPGLSDEDKKSLFKKFARLSARPTAGEHSTGLGLAIVKKISEMIGADITVESELGNGACFTLIIPKE